MKLTLPHALRPFGPYFLAVIAGLMLTLAYPGLNQSYFAYVCFVPLLFALEGQSWRKALLLGWIMGAVMIFLVCHWIADWASLTMGFTGLIPELMAIGYALITGAVFGLGLMFYQFSKPNAKFPDLFFFPMMLAATQSLYPMVFYFTLADSQVPLTVMIQPLDLVGAYGLDFLILLINKLIYEAIKSPRGFYQNKPAKVALGLVGLWVGYGFVAQNIWHNRIEGWQVKKIGLVQTNRPATLSLPQQEPGFSRTYPLEMSMTKTLALLDADVVVWPEGHFYGFTFWVGVKEAFQNEVKALGVPVVLHDITHQPIPGSPDQRLHFNSSIFLHPVADQPLYYHKRNLVPFGEYTPLIGDLSLAKALLGDFLTNLTPGTRQEIFQASGMKLVPQICYETVFPMHVALALQAEGKGKVFVVQSQDGWYGPTNQTQLHLAGSVLRAVENRVPLIHSINNGPSSLVTPAGDFTYQTQQWQQLASVGELPFDPNSGGSFFTQNPYLFIGTIRMLAILSILFRVRDIYLAMKAQQG